MFKTIIKTNGETKDEDIVNAFVFMLKVTISEWG